MKLEIIYRLCDKPEAENRLPRPFGMNKKQVIGSCLTSLVKSVETLGDACQIHIIGDDLTTETKEFVAEVAPKAKSLFFNPPLKNAGSLKKAFEIAGSIEGHGEDTWVYFCEDDYLHDPNTFVPRFLDFVALSKSKGFALPVFYHPTDYPDQYTRLLSRTYLFQGVTGYFREVASTTMTVACQLKTFKQFSSWFNECTVDDGKFSTIFKKSALCFSPLPGTATHMHEGVMSTYVNWPAVMASLF